MVASAVDDDSLPRLILFGDSFSGAVIPFLQDHFSRALIYQSPWIDEKLIATERPDIVIVECVERGLPVLLDTLP